MTLRELSQHIRLQEQLTRDQEILESLQAAALPGAQVMTGMPHTAGARDKVGDLATEIADLKKHILQLKKEIARSEAGVAEFIGGVEDTKVRIILRLRFVRCLTWQQTADVMGIEAGEESARKICTRYLRGLERTQMEGR